MSGITIRLRRFQAGISTAVLFGTQVAFGLNFVAIAFEGTSPCVSHPSFDAPVSALCGAICLATAVRLGAVS